MTDTLGTRRSHLAIVAGELGVSQNELARRTGLAYKTVTAAWHDRAPTSLETWVRLAKALRVPLEQIAPLAAEQLAGLRIR